MARKTPKTKRIKTKNGYRYMVDGKFASKDAYDKAKAGAKGRKSPGRVQVVATGVVDMTRGAKLENVVEALASGKIVLVNQTMNNKLPARLKKNGAYYASHRTTRGGRDIFRVRVPNAAQRKALRDGTVAKPAKKSWAKGRKNPAKKKAAPKRKKGEPTALNIYVLREVFGTNTTVPNQISPTDISHMRRCLNAGLVTATKDKLTLTTKGKAAIKGTKLNPAKKKSKPAKKKAKPRKTATARKNPSKCRANPATALALQVARQIKDHLVATNYTKVTGPKKDKQVYEITLEAAKGGKPTRVIVSVSQIGEKIKVTLIHLSGMGQHLIDEARYSPDRSFGSMVSATLARKGFKRYVKPVKAPKRKPKKSGIFAGFFKNPADMKKVWAKVRRVFTEQRKKMSKEFPALVATGLVADQSVHDSERHYAMTGKIGANKAQVRIAPELGLLPMSAIRGVVTHELGHAAVMLGYKPKRASKGRSYDAIERNADKAAEQLSGLKIFYDKQMIERAGPGAKGKRPRPKGVR